MMAEGVNQSQGWFESGEEIRRISIGICACDGNAHTHHEEGGKTCWIWGGLGGEEEEEAEEEEAEEEEGSALIKSKDPTTWRVGKKGFPS